MLTIISIANHQMYCKLLKVLATLESIANSQKHCECSEGLQTLRSVANTWKYCKHSKVLWTLRSIANAHKYRKHSDVLREFKSNKRLNNSTLHFINNLFLLVPIIDFKLLTYVHSLVLDHPIQRMSHYQYI